MELLDHMVILCLAFWGLAKLFSTVTEPFYIPTSNVWGFQILLILANTSYWQSFTLHHSDEFEMVSHYDFNLYFSNDNEVFPVAQMVKSSPAMQETRVWSLGQEDSPGKGNGNALQYSCLENSMDRETWLAAIRGVAKSWTRLSD